MTAVNPYEQAGRYTKAYKLARVILRVMDQSDVTIEQIAEASDESKRLTAQAAGVRFPSPATWELVVQQVMEARGLSGD